MPTTVNRYNDIQPLTAKDGSEVRELMHPRQHGNQAQSLAEATVYSGQKTALHLHHHSEEIYYVLAGQGTMVLGDQSFAIAPGDSILIPPGTPHALHNTWPMELRVLCCCSPAYDPVDTQLLPVSP